MTEDCENERNEVGARVLTAQVNQGQRDQGIIGFGEIDLCQYIELSVILRNVIFLLRTAGYLLGRVCYLMTCPQLS